MKLLKSAIKLLVVGLGGIIIIAVVIDSYSDPIQQQINEPKSHAKEKQNIVHDDNGVDMSTSPLNNWNYSFYNDDMSGKLIKQATRYSTNRLNFGFPYNGSQTATLTLRRHPRWGKNIIISIEKGQFNYDYDGTYIMIRFDNGKPIRFVGSRPADNSTTTLFIRNYSYFVGKMLKAKKVRIEVPFFQEGMQTLEFNVSDFSVNRYLGK